ncbi:MAG: type IV pilus twitching motility protein PilT [Armatimonadota bacterium]|nr:type IV pilus twitching motility protein PilT [Acidobacteriota bacterium]NLN90597.1 type IV pilus twitching motility protein PilT [candidate division WS1 bacterium]
MIDLTELLTTLVERNGSDLHMKVGQPPVIRVDGTLYRLEGYPRMSPDDVRAAMYSILSQEQVDEYEENLELDLSHSISGVGRYRVNVLQQRGYVGGVFRHIPFQIPSIDELGLPPVLKQISMRPRGLVLVTGPTGSGKSTTLAAMVHHMNAHRHAHIITIEDPLEFIHSDNLCCINQRELGGDTHSFGHALRHVMRQNPDIILVGEMRDLETIQLAITAAETGHLVLATLHTTDAAQTIDRVIDVFPPEQQEQIRSQLATTLEAIVCQTLLPLKSGHGRVAAFEIMVGTPAIKTIVREGKTHQIPALVQTGSEAGMISLEHYLLTLIQQDLVTFEEALAKSNNPREFTELAQRRLGIVTDGQPQA